MIEKAKRHFWFMVHNCIAHPVMGIVPCALTTWAHDWTAERM